METLWWEKNKYVLVRDNYRLNKEFIDNNFIYTIKEGKLWMEGTLTEPFEIDIEIEFPKSYPFSPPNIYPKNKEILFVSGHQYLKSRKFCLDIREKTWNSTLSVVDLIISLKTLLKDEEYRKLNNEKSIRSEEDEEPIIFLENLKEKSTILLEDIKIPDTLNHGLFSYFKTNNLFDSKKVITKFHNMKKEISSQENFKNITDIWGMIASFSAISDFFTGFWIKTNIDNIFDLNKLNSLDEIQKELIRIGFPKISENLKDNSNLILLCEEYDSIKVNLEIKENSIIKTGIYKLDLDQLFKRIPSEHFNSAIKNKKVTLVGCGSGGSKIAEYFVKAGIQELVLIDNEILEVENIIRHNCTLEDIATNKTFAVKNKLLKINPKVNIVIINKKIEVISDDIDDKIKDSDLIIVATAADEEIINNYSYEKQIPSIYSKVYPFGFGGEIIRVIPGITPCYECLNIYKEELLSEKFPDAVFPKIKTVSYDEVEEFGHIPIPALCVDMDFIVLITVKLSLDLLKTNDYQTLNQSNNILIWGNELKWLFKEEYQKITFTTEGMKSLKNCLVCSSEDVIKNELNMNNALISEDYQKIMNKIELKKLIKNE